MWPPKNQFLPSCRAPEDTIGKSIAEAVAAEAGAEECTEQLPEEDVAARDDMLPSFNCAAGKVTSADLDVERSCIRSWPPRSSC